MEITFHKTFLKSYEKLPVKLQRKFEECLKIFSNDPLDERLRNHPLHGKWKGFRSIDVSGDYRAIYAMTSKNSAKFYALGTHSKLYG